MSEHHQPVEHSLGHEQIEEHQQEVLEHPSEEQQEESHITQQLKEKLEKKIKKKLNGIVERMGQTEERINQGNQNIILNAQKDKLKVKRYEQEIAKMHQDYDEVREKDPKVFDSKVHSEVEFALLRISEKRYKAEEEVESLKQVLNKKNAQIRDLEIQNRQFKEENTQLKNKVTQQKKKPKILGLRNEYDDLNERETVSEAALSMKKSIRGQPEYDEDDAFWYQNESPVAKRQENVGNYDEPSFEPTKSELWVMTNDKNVQGMAQGNAKSPIQNRGPTGPNRVGNASFKKPINR